jgi:DNA-binding NtrC family response regulator
MKPLRVLIVDDEARLREILVRAIGSWGFTAVGARSAEEGLRLMEAEPFDISILDLNLPSMMGMELFEKIRRKWPDHQVIILTGFGDLDSARAAIHLEVVDFLKKPCHLGELEQALAKATQRLAKPPELPPEMEEEPEEVSPPESDAKLEDVERQHILAALRRLGGNRTATATDLGISRRTLQYKLNEYKRQGYEVD